MLNSRGEQINLPQDVINDDRLIPHAVILYIKLKYHANKKGFIRMSSKDLGYHRSSLKKWANNLELCGLIKTHEPTFNNMNTYQLLK